MGLKRKRETTPDFDGVEPKSNNYDLLYGLNDTPPWYLCIVFGMQHFLLSVGGIIGVPLLLGTHLCLPNDEIGSQARANLICSVFLVSGVSTVLQSTLGNRLPILQGSSFAFFAPTLSILALQHNMCPDPLPPGSFNSSKTLYNDTDGSIIDGNELWMRRIREVQGSMTVSCLFEVLLAATGSVTLLLRFIGPLTIMPAISLIGLDLLKVAPYHAQTHWPTALFTTFILVLCSQYLKDIEVPLPSYVRKGKFHFNKVQVFKMFPVLIALLLGWTLDWILTLTDVLSPNPNEYSYRGRADIRIDVFESSPWFRIPYPGQWGLPRISFAGVVGMMAGVIASIVESVGDYYACAKLSEAPRPPPHAINRGILMEGLGCIFGGLVGTGTGTTSFSENIAAIGITRVGSRRVLQVAGAVFVVFGCFGKIGSLFVTVPEPVLGGLFMVMFGMIAAVGLSNLQFVDLNSPRNIFIIGFTLFMGLAIPNWLRANPDAIATGSLQVDQIFYVLLTNAMLVGGGLAIILDNTLPGTPEERGFANWENSHQSGFKEIKSIEEFQALCYDLPFSTNFRLAKYIPIFPEFYKRLNSKAKERQTNTSLDVMNTIREEDVQDVILNGNA